MSFLKLEEKSGEWDFYSLAIYYFIQSHGIFLSVIASNEQQK